MKKKQLILKQKTNYLMNYNFMPFTALSKLATVAGFSLIGILTPLIPLAVCTLIFIGVDFILGLWASLKRGETFSSAKGWDTIKKTVLAMLAISLAFLIDTYILVFTTIYMANILTAIICAFEFWSFLENASEISNHQVFRALKKYTKNKLEKELNDGETFDCDETKKTKED